VKRIAIATLLLLLAGCGIGNPSPSVPAGTDATETHTVLLLGDSFLNQTAPMLPGALSWHGLGANVVDDSYPGTGLLDPHMVANQIAKIAAHPRADIVVIEFSGNCFDCPVAYGSEDFFKRWSANLSEIVDEVESRGMHVVLVVPPPIRADLTWAAVQHELGLRAARLALTNHLALANWSDALADASGNYQQVLSYGDLFGGPALHTVRNDDGVHLTADGARRTADWTAAAMRPFWAVTP
jgi:lysophospholipase L1-like esterase